MQRKIITGSLELQQGLHQDPHNFRLLPVSVSTYHQLQKNSGAAGVTIVEVVTSHKLYQVISRFVAKHGNKTSSHSHSWTVANSSVRRINYDEDDDGKDDEGVDEAVELQLGLGVHEVTFEGRLITVLVQAVGHPVGGPCGAQYYSSLVLVVDGEGQQDVITAFCNHVLAWDSEKDDRSYNIYMWKPRHQYWNKVATKRIRPIESVILPEDVKSQVMQDLTDFNTRETARWYTHHGIPYKRSLLFFGPPGTGKSSFITALAGELGRNVCFLQPAHPDITDDNLQTCVQSAPANSLIVMEDVDALFTKDREGKAAGKDSAPLTFSGLLNALDGVCNPEGQVFILTTNHIERLDPALIRPGRVDLKVRFTTATKKQASTLFQHFYPGEEDRAQEFADLIAARFAHVKQDRSDDGGDKREGEKTEEHDHEGLGVSMAALQQLFILCRKASPQEALDKAKSFCF